ncbi:hypothetical protein HYZ97_02915 [Candidatus Pacearchaeota archaeon]|nr:hypothetical protein [Candidatus Pacearchaeota archaeon]
MSLMYRKCPSLMWSTATRNYGLVEGGGDWDTIAEIIEAAFDKYPVEIRYL